MVYNCCKCKRTSEEVNLVSVFTAGQFFMCFDCIKKIAKEENKIPLFHPLKGLSFFTEEEANLILEEQGAKCLTLD